MNNHEKYGLSPQYWQDRYDQGKTGWDRGSPSPMLLEWLASGALKPCTIFVPGCGRGHEVLGLAKAGFQVTAVDYADSAVQSLQSQLKHHQLKAEVVQADIFQFCPTQLFDAIYEQTCLCAIDPAKRETYEQRITSWLRPQGKLFALFMQTYAADGPPFACPLGEMQKLFSTGWTWTSEPKRVEHPMGLHEWASVLQKSAKQ